ncbi:hypothetical protein ABTY20_23400 [Streptomyces sp. NPDC126497]|uniref:hypothetical protein n=1 Tax=Streptomyces sp. NPDC126497 TaxID=3155313 RepID=UPI003316B4D4
MRPSVSDVSTKVISEKAGGRGRAAKETIGTVAPTPGRVAGRAVLLIAHTGLVTCDFTMHSTR